MKSGPPFRFRSGSYRSGDITRCDPSMTRGRPFHCSKSQEQMFILTVRIPSTLDTEPYQGVSSAQSRPAVTSKTEFDSSTSAPMS